MAEHSTIEWTDATWNPITGCSVVSPGCTNCYAMKLAGTRLKHIPSRAGLTTDSKAGPVWNGQVRLNSEWLDQPLRWRRPRRIFVCAHGDLFHEAVPDEWIDQIFAVMALAPQHTFQVLTKRAKRMREYLTGSQRDHRIVNAQLKLELPVPDGDYRWPHMPLPNVWLGVSAEYQARADERIPELLATPAAVRFLSAEPLLGPIDIGRWTASAKVICKVCTTSFWLHEADPCQHAEGGGWTLACPQCGDCRCKPAWTPANERVRDMQPPQDWVDLRVGRFDKVDPKVEMRSMLDWVIVGGESGRGARPMQPQWAESIRDQCAAAGTPFFFKQWGSHRMTSDCNGRYMIPASKKEAGRLLGGLEHNGMPEVRS